MQLLDRARAAHNSTQELEIEQDEEGESGLLDASLAPTDSEPPTDEPPTDITAPSDGTTPSGSRVPTPTPTEVPPKKKRKQIHLYQKQQNSLEHEHHKHFLATRIHRCSCTCIHSPPVLAVRLNELPFYCIIDKWIVPWCHDKYVASVNCP